ncbi:MAG: hypothetical protein JG781_1149 [Peptococcaceae bacterium]|nr:hypothetical protein [Peptococcaceae bacterium]
MSTLTTIVTVNKKGTGNLFYGFPAPNEEVSLLLTGLAFCVPNHLIITKPTKSGVSSINIGSSLTVRLRFEPILLSLSVSEAEEPSNP